jgi:hypothetical protein
MKRTVEIVQINPGLNIVGQPHIITVHKGVASVLTFKGIGGQVGKYVFALLAGFGTVPTGMAFTDNGDGTASISGTPTAYGDFPITMTLDNNGRAIKKSFIIRVPALTLQFVQTAPVYAGIATTPGQIKLEANGGSGSGYTYSIPSAPGAVDSVTGYITPGISFASPGTYGPITGDVTDGAGNSASVNFALIVLAPIVLDCILPTEAMHNVGLPGSGTFQFKVKAAPGATIGAITWSSLSGATPAGFTFTSGGLLSGITSAAGGATYSPLFSVRATDALTGTHLDIDVPMTVYGEFKAMISVSKATITTGVPSLIFANFQGGKPPYRISTPFVGNPAGLTLEMAPDGSHYFLATASQAFAQTLIGADLFDALGFACNGSGANRLTVISSINQQIQVRESGSDVGDPGPTALDFVGATVTDDGLGGRVVTLGTAAALAADTDGTLAANSDSRVATQKATKTYVDNAVTGLFDFKGATNCSGNPNYPAASKGDAYVVSTAGKIGGASGAAVDIGDVFVASADNAGGTQAGVGASWFILEHNLAGALLIANNLSDVASAFAALDNLTKQGADIASAATTDIGAATGRNVNITGTTTITALGVAAVGVERVTRFTGALTLTYDAASLITITAANIVTAANDQCGWLSLGSGNWRMQWYAKADGTALVGGGGASPGVSFSPANLAAGIQTGNLSSSIMSGPNTTAAANQTTGSVFCMGASGHTCVGVQAFIFNTTGAPLTYTLELWDGVSAALLGSGNVTVAGGASGLYSISFAAISLSAHHTYIASIYESSGTWVTYAGSQSPSFASPINAGNDLIYFCLRAYAFNHAIPANPQYAYSACVEPLIT